MADLAGIKDAPVYKDNPFVHDELGFHQKRRTEVIFDGSQALIQADTGEILDDSIHLARVKYIDPDKFVKVYVSQMSVLFELSSSAQKVARYIFHLMSQTIGSDRVYLGLDELQDFLQALNEKPPSKMTYNRAVRELLSKNLIARTKRPSEYFINPAIAFNGDRARFITEIRKKRKSKTERLEDDGQLPLIN